MSGSVFSILNAVYEDLHAASAADVVFFTDAGLTVTLADHVKHLCQNTGITPARDTATVALAAGTAVYALPADCLSVIAVAINGVPLLPSSTFELEFRDPTLAAASTPQRPITWWYADKIGPANIGFYPVPSAADAGSTVEIVFHNSICNIDAAHTVTTIPLPQVFADWAAMQVLADSYQQESDFRSVDIAQGYSQLASLMFEAFRKYWYGGAQ